MKMIIKEKSPTMRHVFRNHRVTLDWLLDRINLDTKDQIKYVDTKNHIVDLLFKGSYSCDERDLVLRLLIIMNFSILSCSQFLSIEKTNTMSKRDQERRTGEESAEVKSRSTSLISRNQLFVRQTASLDSDASNVPGNPDLDSISVPGSTGTLVRDRVKNPATSSQEWQKHNPCPGSKRKLVQSGTCERSGSIGEQVQDLENQQGHGWTSTMCRSPTVNSLRKSSKRFDRNYVAVLTNSMGRPTYRSCDYLCQRRWKYQFFLGFTTMKIWLRTGTPTSRSSRR